VQDRVVLLDQVHLVLGIEDRTVDLIAGEAVYGSPVRPDRDQAELGEVISAGRRVKYAARLPSALEYPGSPVCTRYLSYSSAVSARVVPVHTRMTALIVDLL
jgi:hypothetical protein